MALCGRRVQWAVFAVKLGARRYLAEKGRVGALERICGLIGPENEVGILTQFARRDDADDSSASDAGQNRD
jgi:hypothetical protein